jgi:glycosyltransferase involved in cell wall biosynthesis
MSSLNSKRHHLHSCFESIKNQIGNFNIEVVVVNDGSNKEHTNILRDELAFFESSTRFCTVKYISNDTNKGLGYSLNRGLQECSNEIVLRMDTDDIMKEERISVQLEFMKKNPECALCGSQVEMFKDDDVDNILSITRHISIAWSDYKKSIRLQNNHWMMNHPTFCLRRSKILEVGNYNDTIHSMVEDFDLILRVLKRFGKIYNLPKSLLKYRLHGNQLTNNAGHPKWKQTRNELVKKYIM